VNGKNDLILNTDLIQLLQETVVTQYNQLTEELSSLLSRVEELKKKKRDFELIIYELKADKGSYRFPPPFISTQSTLDHVMLGNRSSHMSINEMIREVIMIEGSPMTSSAIRSKILEKYRRAVPLNVLSSIISQAIPKKGRIASKILYGRTHVAGTANTMVYGLLEWFDGDKLKPEFENSANKNTRQW
jgi:hypothetical protein